MYEMGLLEDQAGHPDEAIRWLERAKAMPKQRVRADIYLSDVLLQTAQLRSGGERGERRRESSAQGSVRTLRAEPRTACGGRQSRRRTDAAVDESARRLRSGRERDDRATANRCRRLARTRVYSLEQGAQGRSGQSAGVDIADRNRDCRSRLREGRAACKAHQRAVSVQRIGSATAGRFGGRAWTDGDCGHELPGGARQGKERRHNASPVSRLRERGDSGRALAVLEQSLRENPNDSVVLRVLADGQLRAGKVAAARGNYDRLLQRNSNDVEVLNNLAQVALRQVTARLRWAMPSVRTSWRKTIAAIIDTLGWVLVRQGQLDRGIGLLRDARLRDSSNPRNPLSPGGRAGANRPRSGSAQRVEGDTEGWRGIRRRRGRAQTAAEAWLMNLGTRPALPLVFRNAGLIVSAPYIQSWDGCSLRELIRSEGMAESGVGDSYSAMSSWFQR